MAGPDSKLAGAASEPGNAKTHRPGPGGNFHGGVVFLKTWDIVSAMIRRILCFAFVLAASQAWAQQADAPSIADFANVTQGRYQVFAQGGHQLAFEINMFMNGMLRQYEKYFNNWTLKEGTRVIVFDNPDDFRRYAGSVVTLTHAGLAGYCYFKTDEAGNQFYELVTYQDANLWRVLAHEGFHQFIGYELGQQIPLWLNEGMAQYFETSFVTGTHFNVGQVSRQKLMLAQYLILNKQAPPLAQLIQWDRSTFYANANVAYPMSWALVYYLLNSNGDRFQQGEFRRYLQDLKLGKDDIASFHRRFGQDSGRWQADFEDYILHLKAQTN
ncbi:MAG TPA: DUF1570 domain-containing protein [Verrucomicrobiae bacterium]|nr:DUF1570 domain-containing protein [Verrucomicrobiae bacterium]